MIKEKGIWIPVAIEAERMAADGIPKIDQIFKVSYSVNPLQDPVAVPVDTAIGGKKVFKAEKRHGIRIFMSAV
jgi:hypothetical protein